MEVFPKFDEAGEKADKAKYESAKWRFLKGVFLHG
jgi:hypothetical protein